MAINQLAFAEFIPGRIDHHNIQITLVMIAMACATAVESRSNWALLAGASTGLALAVGIEGLPFHVVIGASYALLAALGRDETRTTRNYAVALLGATLVCYLLQTPPWRWSMASKNLRMSISRTHPPRTSISRCRSDSSAWCPERPGRNPYEQSRKSCS